MPLFKTIEPNYHTRIFVWKIEESLEYLSENIFLTVKSQERVGGMKSEIHKKGFLSVRYLLNEAGYNDDDLYYLETGKPCLKDGKHISITHSFYFSAIIISDVKVGIDIEKCRDKILNVSTKFIGNEANFLDKKKQYIEQLTVVWGAKESLYKLVSSQYLSFKNDIEIQPFKMRDKKTIGKVQQSFFQVYFEKIEEFMLVYSHPNPPEGREL